MQMEGGAQASGSIRRIFRSMRNFRSILYKRR
jgi:hypothetical protein